jgi:Protein of unknown function (DUF3616)
MTPPLVVSSTAFVQQKPAVLINASGVVPVGPSRFVFIDNRNHTELLELVLNPDGTQREPLKRRRMTGLSRGSLSDPEGLTRIDANGAVDLILASSLSVWHDLGSGQRGTNQGLVRVRYRPEGDLVAEAMPGFRDWLLARHPALAPVAGLDPDHGGLNIEGLAWDPVRKVLLFGVRAPAKDGRISVLQLHLKSTDAQWTTAALEARPVLEIHRSSLLPAQGIRDLTYDTERQEFLVILGRSISRGAAPFQLCRWDGTSVTVEVLDVSFDRMKPEGIMMKPEGITVFDADRARRILIVDDAGGFATFSAADAGD